MIVVEPYKPLYTVAEAAKILKMSPSDVYELLRSKKLSHIVLGSKKIRGSDLERFIEKYEVEESA